MRSSAAIGKSLVCISMENVQAHWTVMQNENFEHPSSNGKSDDGMHMEECEQPLTLANLNIDFPTGKLIGIIGPVGAGKSSLLQAILRELPLKSGSIHIDGTISYANQESWVFAASIRQNILFGDEYNRDRYNKVVECCALARDFEDFENGDLTLVGERGSSISGGQKARIKYAYRMENRSFLFFFGDQKALIFISIVLLQFSASMLSKSRYLLIGRSVECGGCTCWNAHLRQMYRPVRTVSKAKIYTHFSNSPSSFPEKG